MSPKGDVPSSRELGGAERDRTDDLRLAKPALSQLSYSPKLLMVEPPRCRVTSSLFVGQGRVELPTSRLSGVRSNHLSYWPEASLHRREWLPKVGDGYFPSPCASRRIGEKGPGLLVSGGPSATSCSRTCLVPWKLNRTHGIGETDSEEKVSKMSF